MSNRSPQPVRVPVDDTTALEQALASVRESIEKMRFGQVQLTVHDGRLVQLDVTERQRFA